MRTKMAIMAALLSVFLVGCGGGSGGDSPAVCRPTMANPDLCLTGTAVGLAPIALSLADPSGVATTQVTLDRPGTLLAVVKDKKGSAIANVAVTFATTDKTGVFVPSSGTALTDANGFARVGLPAGAQAGGFMVTANVLVSGNSATGTLGYAVTFPTLTLSALTIAPASLSAGGTSSIGLTVLNGASPFIPAQSVSFTSPCVIAGKAAISSPVATVNGVASTSYTDKGCGGADIITASTSLAGATFTQTGTVTVLPATAGQIAFVSALPQNIAMKGTGGAGRQESSTVSFKVRDKNGVAVSGVLVDFALTTTVGGLTLNPVFATSGADGTVVTVVAAGIVNTPVRVLATIRGSAPILSTVSDQLVISTGIPDQNSFTVVPKIYNIECADHDGTDFTTVTALVADHFNNPVPDGTAVSFTTEAGAIDASCLTGLDKTTLTDGSVILQKGVPGQCTVRFICQNPHPRNFVPATVNPNGDGRSTVLAYALGEESFTDDPSILNGINRYDLSEGFQDLREPFRYDMAITNLEARGVNNNANNAVAPALGEPFIDSDGDGLWNSVGNSIYNGVLQSVPNGATPTIHVRESFVLVFSGSDAVITPLSPVPVALDHCVGLPFANTARTFSVAIRDNNPTFIQGNSLPGNILPAGTKIEFIASGATISGISSFTVPNTNEPSSAVWTYSVGIQSDATVDAAGVCSNPSTSGVVTVKVTTPLGVVTTTPFGTTD